MAADQALRRAEIITDADQAEFGTLAGHAAVGEQGQARQRLNARLIFDAAKAERPHRVVFGASREFQILDRIPGELDPPEAAMLPRAVLIAGRTLKRERTEIGLALAAEAIEVDAVAADMHAEAAEQALRRVAPEALPADPPEQAPGLSEGGIELGAETVAHRHGAAAAYVADGAALAGATLDRELGIGRRYRRPLGQGAVREPGTEERCDGAHEAAAAQAPEPAPPPRAVQARGAVDRDHRHVGQCGAEADLEREMRVAVGAPGGQRVCHPGLDAGPARRGDTPLACGRVGREDEIERPACGLEIGAA